MLSQNTIIFSVKTALSLSEMMRAGLCYIYGRVDGMAHCKWVVGRYIE